MAQRELAIIITGKDAASKTLGDVSDKAGGMGKAFGVAALGIGVAGVGIGAALFKIGSDTDSAFDAIRVGTGATGSALAGLQDDFRAVAKQVPGDFGTISSVIADLNTRTGATGETLQGLSTRIIEMSRLTGTDAAENVALATRVFGDWSVATEDQGGALDMLFRASQATGIGIGALQGKVVQFGAPLRAMGFSLEESASLLGKWEKEGVNSELVLGSMRIAMGKFAKDGVPMRQGLDDTIAKIQKLGPGAAATSLAMEVFGARAGPDMAAAILEGRFELGELLGQVKGGSETILGAADATKDGAERWQESLNRITLALEPVAMGVFNLVGAVIEQLAPAIEAGVDAVGPFAAALGEQLGGALQTASAFMATLEPSITAVVDTVALMLGLDPGAWGTSWEGVQAIVGQVMTNLNGVFQAVSTFVSENLQPIMTGLAAVIAAVVIPAFAAWAIGAATAAAATVIALAPVLLPLAAIGVAAGLLKAAWDTNFGDIQGKTEAVWSVVAPIFESIFGELARFWTEIQPLLAQAWDAITNKVRDAITLVSTVISAVMGAIDTAWQTNWGGIRDYVGTIWTAIELVVSTVWTAVQGLITAGLQLISGDWTGAWNTIQETTGTVLGNVQTLLVGILPQMAEAALNLGKAIFEGIVGALANLGQALIDKIGAAIRSIDLDFGWIRISGSNGVSFNFPTPSIPMPNLSIPGFAHGTNSAPGGLAIVGERGPELVNLPRGAQVIPTDRVGGVAIDYNRLAAAVASRPVVVQINGREIARVVREELLRQKAGNLSVGLS